MAALQWESVAAYRIGICSQEGIMFDEVLQKKIESQGVLAGFHDVPAGINPDVTRESVARCLLLTTNFVSPLLKEAQTLAHKEYIVWWGLLSDEDKFKDSSSLGREYVFIRIFGSPRRPSSVAFPRGACVHPSAMAHLLTVPTLSDKLELICHSVRASFVEYEGLNLWSELVTKSDEMDDKWRDYLKIHAGGVITV